MGTRFRKSFKVAPGVRVNLGKKSAGISVGNKYGGVSVNSKTGAKGRVSAPGTGMSYTTSLNSKAKRNSNAEDFEEAEFDLHEYIKTQEASYNLSMILYPALTILLLATGWLLPILYVGLLAVLWFEKTLNKDRRIIATAKYKEACIESGREPSDCPNDSDIAPYLPLDGKYDKSGKFHKRKPIYKRVWFIILSAISLFLCYIVHFAA